MKRGIPERGDILHLDLDLDPALGKEQQGQRYVLVLTLSDFNRFGLALVAPVTQGGQFARENGFTVSMMGAGTNTQGVVLCNQVRMLDFKKRNAKVIEAAPETLWIMSWPESGHYWNNHFFEWENGEGQIFNRHKIHPSMCGIKK